MIPIIAGISSIAHPAPVAAVVVGSAIYLSPHLFDFFLSLFKFIASGNDTKAPFIFLYLHVLSSPLFIFREICGSDNPVIIEAVF